MLRFNKNHLPGWLSESLIDQVMAPSIRSAMPEQNLIQSESLILAQSERWRQA